MVEITIASKHLTREFNSSGLKTRVCVEDWEAYGGEVVHITGGSGSGKSTVLAMAGGFLTPSSGKITVRMNNRVMDPEQMRKAGLLSCCFQQPMLEPQLTAKQNCQLFGVSDSEISHFFHVLDISDVQDRPVVELSGGQQRRVGLARALGVQRPLCIIDEPLAGLDDEAAVRVAQAIDAYRSQGNIVIFASHQLVELTIINRRAQAFIEKREQL